MWLREPDEGSWPDMSRVFAVGSDSWEWESLSPEMKERFIEPFDGSFECPAVSAGYEPESGDLSVTVANVYDEIVNQRDVIGIDLLSEEDAKEAWLDAVASVRFAAENDDVMLVYPALDSEKHVRAGEAIARELGWLDEGESVEPKRVEEVLAGE